MAEDLTQYYQELGVRVRYLHSDIETLERVEILRDLRRGEFDVLVGINLLREGLDLPEVSLVAILDADKEGFLRSERSLIQTAGRAARNVKGRVILYADVVTDSMRRALGEFGRRRDKQLAYNLEHAIVPRTIEKSVEEVMRATSVADAIRPDEDPVRALLAAAQGEDPQRIIAQLEREMLEAARGLDFERAASLRDRADELREAVAAAALREAVAAAAPGVARGTRDRRAAAREPRRIKRRFGPGH